jgi:segregation and condensation protein B
MASEQPPRDDPSPEQLGRSYEALLRSWEDSRAESTEAAAGEAATETPPPAERIVEALLFVGGEPLSAARAAQMIRGLTAEQFHQGIDLINRQYRRQARPYAVVRHGDGFVLTLRPRYRDVVEKLYGSTREARLSPAAIDALALVAYRQPVTKAEIDGIRGAESGHLLRQLIRRGLITILHRADAHQRDVTYATTPRFLKLFGLSSLDDLPRTQELQQM